jgi:hypothetical protein
LLARESDEFDESYFKFLSDGDAAVVTDKSLWVRVGEAMNWKGESGVARYVDKELLPRVDGAAKKPLAAKLRAKRPDILAKLSAIQDMLNKRRIFYFDIDNQNLDEVVGIFTRINSGGMTLKKSDLLFSLLVSQWQEGRDEIKGLVQSMRDSDIDVSQDFVMRCCLVLSGARVKLNLDSFKAANIGKIRDNWDRIKSSLVEMCDLLPEIGYIDHPSLSENALIPIALYIMLGANCWSDTAKRHLRRYYAVSQVNGIFGGHSDEVLEKFVAEIKDQMEVRKAIKIEALMDVKLSGSKSMKLTLGELDELVDDAPYGSPRAHFLLSLIFPTIQTKSGRYEMDHIHPRKGFKEASLRSIGVPEDRIAEWNDWRLDALPNLQLLDFSENAKKNARTIVEYLNKNPLKDRRAFVSKHFLPDWRSPLLELENFDAFYENRKKILIKKLRPHFGL